jgi:hypothetical protein
MGTRSTGTGSLTAINKSTGKPNTRLADLLGSASNANLQCETAPYQSILPTLPGKMARVTMQLADPHTALRDASGRPIGRRPVIIDNGRPGIRIELCDPSDRIEQEGENRSVDWSSDPDPMADVRSFIDWHRQKVADDQCRCLGELVNTAFPAEQQDPVALAAPEPTDGFLSVTATITITLPAAIHEALEAIAAMFDRLRAIDSTRDFFTDYVARFNSTPEACIGCQHYHGEIYDGQRFICGMHPYDPGDEICPDFLDIAIPP